MRPFPSGEVIGPISTAGGVMPRWRGDGKEMFYISGDKKMMVVPVVLAQPSSAAGGKPIFEPGTPTPLFDVNLAAPDALTYQYDFRGFPAVNRCRELERERYKVMPPVTG